MYMTALHWTCKRGYLKATQVLLRNNADIEAEDMIGRTPLFFAIEGGYEDVIEVIHLLIINYLHISLLKQFLLVNKANPYKTKYADYSAMAKTYIV